MPTLKEMSDEMRSGFGIGTKSYETTGRKVQDSDITVYISAFVEGERDIQKVRKIVENQTYKNVIPVFVMKDMELMKFAKPGEACISGLTFYDVTKYFSVIDFGEQEVYFIDFDANNYLMPGHVESLVEVLDEGIPVASENKLHDVAGWDGVGPSDNEYVRSSCVLWSYRDLSSWEEDDEFKAVDNLLKGNPKIARTNKPTVVLQK